MARGVFRIDAGPFGIPSMRASSVAILNARCRSSMRRLSLPAFHTNDAGAPLHAPRVTGHAKGAVSTGTGRDRVASTEMG